jgi:hypothetical protein
MVLLWPDKFPLLVPVSKRNTCPNLKNEYIIFCQQELLFPYLSLPSPTTAIRLLSSDQAMSRIGPLIIGYSAFKM